MSLAISASDPTATEPDTGQLATGTGQFTITRSGLPLNGLTIQLGTGGPGTGYATPGVDYVSLPSAVILAGMGASSTTVTVSPMPNVNLPAPVFVQLQVMPGTNYTVGASSNAAVVINPSPTATGLGLLAQYYTNSSTTYSSNRNFNATNLILTRVDPTIDFVWGPTNIAPNLSNGLYTVRWTGQVQPQYSETYVFDVYSDDGCMLWVNDQLLISDWKSQSVAHSTNSITLLAGTRYDLRLDYLQAGGSSQCHLSWYSPSQAEQVIPSSCLYPTGQGLLGQYFTNCSTVYTNPANFNPTNLILTRLDPVIDFNWGPTNAPNLSNGLYTVRWTRPGAAVEVFADLRV